MSQDHAFGPRPAQQHALRRQPRLFRTVDHPHLEPGLRAHRLAERGPVLGIADRRRRSRPEAARPRGLGQTRKAFSVPRGHGSCLAGQPPVSENPAPRPQRIFFVEEIGRAARRAVEDHHAHRVGADVDHADPRQRLRSAVEQRHAEGAPFRVVLGAVLRSFSARICLVMRVLCTARGWASIAQDHHFSHGCGSDRARPWPRRAAPGQRRVLHEEAVARRTGSRFPTGRDAGNCHRAATPSFAPHRRDWAAMIWLTICAFTVALRHSTSVSHPADEVSPHPVGGGDVDPRLSSTAGHGRVPKHTMANGFHETGRRWISPGCFPTTPSRRGARRRCRGSRGPILTRPPRLRRARRSRRGR